MRPFIFLCLLSLALSQCDVECFNEGKCVSNQVTNETDGSQTTVYSCQCTYLYDGPTCQTPWRDEHSFLIYLDVYAAFTVALNFGVVCWVLYEIWKGGRKLISQFSVVNYSLYLVALGALGVMPIPAYEFLFAVPEMCWFSAGFGIAVYWMELVTTSRAKMGVFVKSDIRYTAFFRSLVVLVYVLLVPTAIALAIHENSIYAVAAYNACCLILFLIFICITILFGVKLVKQIEDTPKMGVLKMFLKKIIKHMIMIVVIFVLLIITLGVFMLKSENKWWYVSLHMIVRVEEFGLCLSVLYIFSRKRPKAPKTSGNSNSRDQKRRSTVDMSLSTATHSAEPSNCDVDVFPMKKGEASRTAKRPSSTNSSVMRWWYLILLAITSVSACDLQCFNGGSCYSIGVSNDTDGSIGGGESFRIDLTPSRFMLFFNFYASYTVIIGFGVICWVLYEIWKGGRRLLSQFSVVNYIRVIAWSIDPHSIRGIMPSSASSILLDISEMCWFSAGFGIAVYWMELVNTSRAKVGIFITRYRALFYSLVVLVYVLLIPTSIARAIYHRSKRVSAVYNAFCIFLFCIFIAITTLFGFKLVKQIEDSPRLQKLKNFLKKITRYMVVIGIIFILLFITLGVYSFYGEDKWNYITLHWFLRTEEYALCLSVLYIFSRKRPKLKKFSRRSVHFSEHLDVLETPDASSSVLETSSATGETREETTDIELSVNPTEDDQGTNEVFGKDVDAKDEEEEGSTTDNGAAEENDNESRDEIGTS
ncbi:hypothetical protein PROFUN_07285 [Planoprotostelium fungivorum]|uniref:EGF-like domain-containing protein n=1 Tax=Planoprotostelium fungivorum TaxID=1890364 RepID=A0A2P6NM23_9EUKA|nr:hypothetical protein PROFUN_07285 [Planoprotostelium fungivorum]